MLVYQRVGPIRETRGYLQAFPKRLIDVAQAVQDPWEDFGLHDYFGQVDLGFQNSREERGRNHWEITGNVVYPLGI